MVGIVIASHGHLAQALLDTAQQIVGALPAVVACSVEPAASPDQLKASLRAAIETVSDGQGVIIFADLIGGSPCTQSLSLCRQAKLEVITGVNLPMLLKANSLRHAADSLPELAHQLISYGQRNITCATDLLRSQQG